MFQTIQLSTCVSVQGELVEFLPNGEVIVRDGVQTYRGRPIAPMPPLPVPEILPRPAPAPHGRA